MSKEVIYIDVNDDITSVIEKIRRSDHKIVALVPPKQTGLLQSAVNLRLLAKSSRDVKKYIVIITGKESLMKLAATAKIPVARNLQSKPVIAQLPSFSDEDDTIDGQALAIDKDAQKNSGASVDGAKVSTDEVVVDPDQPIETNNAGEAKSKSTAKLKTASSQAGLRKRMAIIASAVVLLLGFLVWALVFAPEAKISIKTRTKQINIEENITLTDDSSKASLERAVLHAQTQSIEKKRTVEFAATGDKNVGAKATGKVRFTRQSRTATTLPAGTRLTTSSRHVFILTENLIIPRSDNMSAHCFPTACPATVDVIVTALEGGSSYNGQSGSLVGQFDGATAELLSATTGGTDKMVKVVTKEDVEQATQKLKENSDQVAINELKNKFDTSSIVIDDSLQVVEGEIKTSVEVDNEAPNNKATIEQTVKYTLTVLVRSRMVEFLDQLALNKEKNTNIKLKVYDSGDQKLQFSDFVQQDGVTTVKVFTQMRVGPDIDIEEVKEFAKGKGYGEIQVKYEGIEGIEAVDVEFRPLWVRSVPNNPNRINVEINLE